jgi:hypothetical protein
VENINVSGVKSASSNTKESVINLQINTVVNRNITIEYIPLFRIHHQECPRRQRGTVTEWDT